MRKPLLVFLVSTIASSAALTIRGHQNVTPDLEPKLDKKFFGPPFPADYPHDDKPAVAPNVTLKHPYPTVVAADKFEADYVKDGNGDKGEHKAQMEYDSLRAAIGKTVVVAEQAKSKMDEKAKQLKTAKAKVADAQERLKAAEDRTSRARATASDTDAAQLDKQTDAQQQDKEEKNEEHDLVDCRQELEDAQQTLRDLESQHAAAVAQASHVEEEQNNADAKAKELEKQAETAVNAALAARDAVEAAQKKTATANTKLQNLSYEANASVAEVTKEQADLEDYEHELEMAQEKDKRLENAQVEASREEQDAQQVAANATQSTVEFKQLERLAERDLAQAKAMQDEAQRKYEDAMASKKKQEDAAAKAIGSLKGARHGQKESGQRDHSGSRKITPLASFIMLVTSVSFV